MLTKIPFFREVIISSFQCDHCGYSDCGVQSGSRVQDKGVKYTLTVKATKVCCLNDVCALQVVLVVINYILRVSFSIKWLKQRRCLRKRLLSGVNEDSTFFICPERTLHSRLRTKKLWGN